MTDVRQTPMWLSISYFNALGTLDLRHASKRASYYVEDVPRSTISLSHNECNICHENHELWQSKTSSYVSFRGTHDLSFRLLELVIIVSYMTLIMTQKPCGTWYIFYVRWGTIWGMPQIESSKSIKYNLARPLTIWSILGKLHRLPLRCHYQTTSPLPGADIPSQNGTIISKRHKKNSAVKKHRVQTKSWSLNAGFGRRNYRRRHKVLLHTGLQTKTLFSTAIPLAHQQASMMTPSPAEQGELGTGETHAKGWMRKQFQ
jgi:hypothetical protein